ncbi:type VI secretion system baseplate subunit TssG [Massilia haematophila]|uniref:Type VI secretion system baseplate subunit TssG n=1 Tax=Massilia haematophila TaxID=457923 RepID=A0ABV7PHC9_9BURK
MRPSQHRHGTSVIERLLAAPQSFEFVQAVTILLRWLEERGVAPERALRESLRFENSLHLGFPASEIETLQAVRAVPGMAAAAPQELQDEAGAREEPAGPRFSMTATFMGLLGAHGTLPAHYTERIAQWQHDCQDEAPRAFLDMLSGRMLALYYAAWRKYRVEYAVAGPGDDFRARLLALAGSTGGQERGQDDGQERGQEREHGSGPGVPQALIACFAGMLQQRPRSAAALQRLLAGYFGLPVALDEAVGHWSRMAPDEQSALGAGARLGENTLLGARCWRPDLRARLRIGPLDRETFERFLPSGDMAAALRRILARFGVPGVDFEVQLLLRASEVGPTRLEGRLAASSRLGRDSFLVTAAAVTDRADMRYLISPMAPLPPLRARQRSPG